MSHHKGRFITFEGGDGSGKTTLIQKVHAYLEQSGAEVIKTRAPGGTPLGDAIRQLLLGKHSDPMSLRCELFLFLADRAQHVDQVIRPALNQGHIVLCDRFNDSTLAYQGSARGFDPAWLSELLNFACNQTLPDLTLYLDLDPEIGFERAKRGGLTKDRIESEDLAFHRKIRAAFRKISEHEPHRFIMIDATLSPDDVFEQAKMKIDALLHTARK